MKTALTETPADEAGGQQESLFDWLRGWDRFWFGPADPTVLCLIRIFCGIVTLYVHLSYSFGLLDYVGPHGWGDKGVVQYMRVEAPTYASGLNWNDPPREIGKGFVAWSVWYHVENPFWIVVLHVVFLMAMLAYTLGFCTRLSGVITWIATLSYINRMPYMMFGMDVIMVIVQTYLLIGPSGALYSVDRWLQRRGVGWWRNDAEDPDHPPKSVSANIAIHLMQVHFCFIYLVSGLAKLQGKSWWSGEAVFGTIANPNFAPMQSSVYMNVLIFVAQQRWLYHVLIGSAVLYTLVLEIGFPALVWNRRTRWLMITGSVLLHTGIGLLMGLGGFSLFMLVLLLSFVPPKTASAFLQQVQTLLRGPLRKLSAGVHAVLPKGRRPLAAKPKEATLVLQR